MAGVAWKSLAKQAMLFLLFTISILKANSNKNHPFSLVDFVKHENSFLNVNALLSSLVKKPGECGFECAKTLGCYSINLALKSSGHLECDVLPTDKYNESAKFLTNKTGFIHYSIKSSCESRPCLNGATCVSQYHDKGYTCSCPNGFYGKTCEDENECLTGKHNCLTTAGEPQCNDTLKGFVCQCKHGFTGPKCQEKTKEIKANTAPVCVGAKDDAFGEIQLPSAGVVITFKLVHISGGVSPHYTHPPSNWGIMVPAHADWIYIIITTENGVRMNPPQNYSGWEPEFKRYFKMAGVLANDPVLILPESATPRKIFRAGAKFRIWFGEDFANGLVEPDNHVSKTCMDVYVVYRDI